MADVNLDGEAASRTVAYAGVSAVVALGDSPVVLHAVSVVPEPYVVGLGGVPVAARERLVADAISSVSVVVERAVGTRSVTPYGVTL